MVDEGGDTYLTPVHWRFLGDKGEDEHLYESNPRWSDVVINAVPLEKTFQYEDDIVRLQEEKDDDSSSKGFIIVNSRPSQPLIQEKEVENKQWVRRLEKLYPMNFQEAKKKRSKSVERYPVKPKSKKQVRDEKLYCSSDKFNEITDEKLGGESVLDYTIYIQKKDDFKIIKNIKMRTPGDPFWPLEYYEYKVPIRTKYCPPLHWLEPVDWEKIWRHVDYLKTGKKRDYHYYPEGDGYDTKPCIYFYEKDSDNLNYDFDWEKDYMNEAMYFGDYDY